jgi:uncharacterized protein YndB with AHSA1/START domain/DNA-binding transcriptional ArsR family regulator
MVVTMRFAPRDLDRLFGALADPTRRDIVRRAIAAEEGVVELARHHPTSFAAVQKHVALLERAGLVTKQRLGRRKVVRTDLEGLRVAPPARPVRGAVARPDRPHGGAHCRHGGARPMTVTAIRKDPQALTMTLEAEFQAPPERVWQQQADPRQLERWWGPPAYPATVEAHDLRPGARVAYRMAGPAGEEHRGFWEVDEVRPPHRLVVRDGFANRDGTPNPELPVTTLRVTLRDLGGGRTRMSIESELPTVEAMEQLAAMGTEEGRRQAVGQIDALLAEDPAEAGRGRR